MKGKLYFRFYALFLVNTQLMKNNIWAAGFSHRDDELTIGWDDGELINIDFFVLSIQSIDCNGWHVIQFEMDQHIISVINFYFCFRWGGWCEKSEYLPGTDDRPLSTTAYLYLILPKVLPICNQTKMNITTNV